MADKKRGKNWLKAEKDLAARIAKKVDKKMDKKYGKRDKDA